MLYEIQKFIDNFTNSIWITSDLHGFHKNLCRGSSNWPSKDGCRDFENEIEMTKVVTDNINEVVREQDLLISCGDWCFGKEENYFTLREMINCKTIIHIYGNHCQKIRKNPKLQQIFNWTGDYLEFYYKKQLCVFFHYPIEHWKEAEEGSIHCWGHKHLPPELKHKGGRSMDVGLDGNDMKPYLLDDLLGFFNKQPVLESRHS